MMTPKERMTEKLLYCHDIPWEFAHNIAEFVDRAPDNLARCARLMPMLGGGDVNRMTEAQRLIKAAGYMDDEKGGA